MKIFCLETWLEISFPERKILNKTNNVESEKSLWTWNCKIFMNATCFNARQGHSDKIRAMEDHIPDGCNVRGKLIEIGDVFRDADCTCACMWVITIHWLLVIPLCPKEEGFMLFKNGKLVAMVSILEEL